MIGYVIGRYPIVFLIATFIFLIPLHLFFLIYPIQIETDIRRGFAHKSGRSTHEFKAFGQFYNVSMSEMEVLIVILESKDGGRLQMTPELLNEVERLDNYINNLWVSTDDGKKNVTFKELHAVRGSVNFLFHAFKYGFDWQQLNVNNNWTLDDEIHLDHPISTVFGHPITVGSHFFGVERYDKLPEGKASNIKSLKNVVLWYMVGAKEEHRKYLRQIELRIFEKSKGNFSDLFGFQVYGDELVNNEMMSGSAVTTKFLLVGLCIMLCFMGIALRDFSMKQILWLTGTSVGSPMLAMASTFAILGWLDVRLNSMMSISPFLVLGIGVDDAFLLVHSWRKHSPLHQNSITIMEHVISEVGPSITITSVTNVLAFGVGILSPADQLSKFCLCTTIAVALDFLFEFTLFAPSLALCSPRSRRERVQGTKKKNGKIWSKYALFLLTIWGRLLCLVTLITLFVISYFGVSSMEADFDPQKTFPYDSHLQKALKPINEILVEYKPLSFIVHQPPKIENSTQLAEFMKMIVQIESLPGALPDVTQLWLRDYLEYDLRTGGTNSTEEYQPSYQNTPKFLNERLMADKNIVLYHKERSEVIIESFVFVIVFSGERNWHERAWFVEEVRNLIDKYPQFNVSVFDYDSTIFDLLLTVKSEMLKAVLVTLACMMIVCFVFIPNIKYTIIATLSVLSISYNLLGALGLWGNELDPVTLINVLMSIGFSVDFTAHICYHHWFAERNEHLLGIDNNSEEAVHQNLVSSLTSVGKPMLEAASSTVICMFPLFFVNIYVIMSFAKTVLCIGILGLIHGLLILPVLLTTSFNCGRKKRNYREAEASNDSGSPLMPVLS